MADQVDTSPRRDLTLAVIAFVIALVLWQMHGLAFLTYPLRLFVTMIHELGHGTTAVLTGGDFGGFRVESSGAGLALTSGGWRFLIIPAGYLGTAIFGAVLLFLANRSRKPGTIAIGLGFLIGILTLLYSGVRLSNLGLFEMIILAVVIMGALYLILTQQTDNGRYAGFGVLALSGLLLMGFTGENNALTVIVGLASALLLVYLGFRARRDMVLVTLYFLAFITGLHAITDSWVLLRIVTMPRSMMPHNDAASMANEYGGVAAFWALLWIVLDVIIFGSAVFYTLIKPWQQGKTISAQQT